LVTAFNLAIRRSCSARSWRRRPRWNCDVAVSRWRAPSAASRSPDSERAAEQRDGLALRVVAQRRGRALGGGRWGRRRGGGCAGVGVGCGPRPRGRAARPPPARAGREQQRHGEVVEDEGALRVRTAEPALAHGEHVAQRRQRLLAPLLAQVTPS
jgi:hypothetical protein